MGMNMDLFHRSIEIILENQGPSGAYIASPNFPTYHYCWYRDGSFIAYAMDLVGEHESSARFHMWAAGVANRSQPVIRRALQKASAGQQLSGADILHTRYTLEGEEAAGEEWPNFQLDGFGTWLWALEEHLRLSGSPLLESWAQAAGQIASYLAALWQHPCYDCWEEFPDKVHLHTLAAIYGGLQAHSRFSGCDHSAVLDAVRQLVRMQCIAAGHFVKFTGRQDVDASLLGLTTPYRVVEPHDPLMAETAACIEQDLVQGGGVHRYAADTYFGGGEWLLLAGWLGWYYCEIGNLERARSLLSWMEAQADGNSYLPEQVPATLNDPNYFKPWVRRWGSPANPLLWSHAMYLILYQKLSHLGAPSSAEKK
jgi:GH15 family glucan-1,4-alpha-glucosidase